MIRVRKKLRPVGSFLRSLYSTRRLHLLDYDLTRSIPQLLLPVPVVFRAARRSDLDQFLPDPRHELSKRAAARQIDLFESGEPFFVGILDGRIVYRAWAIQRRWRVAGPHELALGRGKACVQGCFTVEDQRGKGVYPAALAAHLGILKGLGLSRAFIYAEDANRASLRGIEKAGFRPVGQYEVIRIAGRVRLIMDSSLRRAVEDDSPA